MGNNNYSIRSKANKIAVAWENLAKDGSFGGLTLDQFKQLLAEAQSKSAVLASMDANYADGMMQRDSAHDALNEAMLNVVDGVKGNTTTYGANSSLYKAMGYVPRNEHRRGLIRKTTATTTNGADTIQTTGTNAPPATASNSPVSGSIKT